MAKNSYKIEDFVVNEFLNTVDIDKSSQELIIEKKRYGKLEVNVGDKDDEGVNTQGDIVKFYKGLQNKSAKEAKQNVPNITFTREKTLKGDSSGKVLGLPRPAWKGLFVQIKELVDLCDEQNISGNVVDFLNAFRFYFFDIYGKAVNIVKGDSNSASTVNVVKGLVRNLDDDNRGLREQAAKESILKKSIKDAISKDPSKFIEVYSDSLFNYDGVNDEELKSFGRAYLQKLREYKQEIKAGNISAEKPDFMKISALIKSGKKKNFSSVVVFFNQILKLIFGSSGALSEIGSLTERVLFDVDKEGLPEMLEESNGLQLLYLLAMCLDETDFKEMVKEYMTIFFQDRGFRAVDEVIRLINHYKPYYPSLMGALQDFEDVISGDIGKSYGKAVDEIGEDDKAMDLNKITLSQLQRYAFNQPELLATIILVFNLKKVFIKRFADIFGKIKSLDKDLVSLTNEPSKKGKVDYELHQFFLALGNNVGLGVDVVVSIFEHVMAMEQTDLSKSNEAKINRVLEILKDDDKAAGAYKKLKQDIKKGLDTAKAQFPNVFTAGEIVVESLLFRNINNDLIQSLYEDVKPDDSESSPKDNKVTDRNRKDFPFGKESGEAVATV